MPINASLSANPVLTATLNNYLVNAEGFVGRRVAPLFLTPEQSAQYYVFDRANMLDAADLKGRAPSTAYPRTQLKLSDDTYRTIDRGLECPVDDGQRKKYAKAFDADAAAEGVHHCVEIGADPQAVHPDVIAGVPDDGDLGIGAGGLEPGQEAGSADSSGQGGDAHGGILSGKRGVEPVGPTLEDSALSLSIRPDIPAPSRQTLLAAARFGPTYPTPRDKPSPSPRGSPKSVCPLKRGRITQNHWKYRAFLEKI